MYKRPKLASFFATKPELAIYPSTYSWIGLDADCHSQLKSVFIERFQVWMQSCDEHGCIAVHKGCASHSWAKPADPNYI